MLSFSIQVVIILIAIVIPLIYTEVLPKTTLTSFLTAPPPPPPPPPPPVEVKVVKVAPRQFDAGRLLAPREIPKQVAIIKEDEIALPTNTLSAVGGIPGGLGPVGGGALGGILGNMAVAPPPPPKVEQKAAAPTRIRVGGNVQQANLLKRVQPNYPPLAKQARIQGVVHLTAIISKDGTIQNLQVISGHPLLVPAALEAVKEWVYKPTLLNGEPVEVVTQIDVNFTLSQ